MVNGDKMKLLRSGKVRDIYELDNDNLLLVASDRVSAFDSILPSLIDGKGKMLTEISGQWFRWIAKEFPEVETHFISDDVASIPLENPSEFEGRSVEVRKLNVYPVEFVVRGYITGSGWKDYVKTGSVQGIDVGEGLVESDKLSTPIFTPTTKTDDGHDEPLTWNEYQKIMGETLAVRLKDLSIAIYEKARSYAEERGILLADTKFEWGYDASESMQESKPILIDEVLTPDSSRYWEATTWKPGSTPHSFDKQFVRDYLKSIGWSGAPPEPPALPDEIISQTLDRYEDAYRRLFS